MRSPTAAGEGGSPTVAGSLLKCAAMGKREQLSDEAVEAFLASHAGWARAGGGGALTRTFAFDDYAAGLAFAVRVGFLAEARDHHPDLHIGWRKVEVVWSTHETVDAEGRPRPTGGITALDVDLAERTEALVR